MVGLLDIAPAADSVIIRGKAVDVCGVSATGIAHLFSRFPDLRKAFSGRDVPVEDLVAMGGEVVAAVIAAGCGAVGSADHEAVAAGLSVDEQVDLLAAIARVTLPGGLGPFVEKLTGAGGALGIDTDAVLSAAQDTK